MTSEKHLVAIFLEKFLSENFEPPEPLSEQRKEELENEISDVAKIFNGYGRPWFIAGGTALELAEGKLTRDHQDTDIAIFYEDVRDFFRYATQLGYEFLDFIGKKIENADVLFAQQSSAAIKSDKSKPGPGSFEVIFLRRNADGNVIFGHDNRLAFPKAIYENPLKYTAANGQIIFTTPKEIGLLYKISEGRNKDFHDIKKFLPTLSKEERGRLNGYLKSIGVTFIIGDRETGNLDELLQLKEITAKEAKENLLASKVNEVISKNRERYRIVIGKIFEISQRVNPPENFFDEIKKELGADFSIRRKTELEESFKFLFADRKPTQEEFHEFAYRAFNFQQYLEKEVERAAMRRWQVRII